MHMDLPIMGTLKSNKVPDRVTKEDNDSDGDSDEYS